MPFEQDDDLLLLLLQRRDILLLARHVLQQVQQLLIVGQRPAQPLLNWLTQEPTDVDARRLLAQYYQRTGANREVIAQLDRILEITPNDVVSLNNLAWALLKTDPQRAESLARRAHAIAPQQPAFADTLGSALIANGKYADAAKVLGDAV